MVKDRPIVVSDLIEALKKLPPETPIHCYSATHQPPGAVLTLRNQRFYKWLNVKWDAEGKPILFTEYDAEQWPAGALDFGENEAIEDVHR